MPLPPIPPPDPVVEKRVRALLKAQPKKLIHPGYSNGIRLRKKRSGMRRGGDKLIICRSAL
jgi:hypothetical protein